MFRVIVAYEPSRTGECSLNEGDEVDNIKNVGNGWVLGRNVTTGDSGVFPEECIDRNSSISGAIIRRVTKRPKSVKLEKPPKVILLPEKPPKVDTMPDEMPMPEIKPEDPKDIREKLGQTTNAVKEKLADLKYKLIDTGEDQYKCYKALFRIFGAIVACVGLYLLLYFSFGYDLMESGFLALGVLLFFVLGFVFSAFLRCACLIMVPNLCTKKGRTIFLTIITGLLLSGPIMNISQNTEQVATSLGCVADLVKNQTTELRRQLEEPLRELGRKVLNYLNQLKKIVDTIHDGLRPILNVLGDMQRGISSAINTVRKIANVSFGTFLFNMQ